MLKFNEPLVRSFYKPPPHTPLPQQYLSKVVQHLNMKSEADRRLTFEKWPVAFMDKNNQLRQDFTIQTTVT
jgi:hypothetical protein